MLIGHVSQACRILQTLIWDLNTTQCIRRVFNHRQHRHALPFQSKQGLGLIMFLSCGFNHVWPKDAAIPSSCCLFWWESRKLWRLLLFAALFGPFICLLVIDVSNSDSIWSLHTHNLRFTQPIICRVMVLANWGGPIKVSVLRERWWGLSRG